MKIAVFLCYHSPPCILTDLWLHLLSWTQGLDVLVAIFNELLQASLSSFISWSQCPFLKIFFNHIIPGFCRASSATYSFNFYISVRLDPWSWPNHLSLLHRSRYSRRGILRWLFQQLSHHISTWSLHDRSFPASLFPYSSVPNIHCHATWQDELWWNVSVC